MRTEDGHLIQKCLNGDSSAFGYLVDKYRSGVYAHAYAKLRNFHDAEDVAQEVFTKAYEKLHTLKRWDNFSAWLYSITSNLCKMWMRSRANRPDREYIEEQEEEILDAPSVDAYHDKQAHETLHEALAALPENYRQVLTLYYLGGMDGQEIAAFLGRPPSTVRQQLSRARNLLKEEMHTMMSATYDEMKLQPSFTFRVVELIKQTKIQPAPRTMALPWGLSISGGLIAIVLSLIVPYSPFYPIGALIGSALPSKTQVAEVGLIPVDVVERSKTPIVFSSIENRISPYEMVEGRGIIAQKPRYEVDKSDLHGTIENWSALFKNREEIVRSREPGPNCYGIAFSFIYVDGVKGKHGEIPPPWEAALRENPDASALAIYERIIEKFPQAEVKLLLDERVNLYPGRRCWGFNSWGEMPIIGNLLRFILNASPVQPSAIKFLYKGEVRYIGLAVNTHREGIQVWFTDRDQTLAEALDINKQDGVGYTSFREEYSQSGGVGSSWGGVFNTQDRSGTYYGHWKIGKIIKASRDHITLYPGEVLDLSQPPLMSIIK